MHCDKARAEEQRVLFFRDAKAHVRDVAETSVVVASTGADQVKAFGQFGAALVVDGRVVGVEALDTT